LGRQETGERLVESVASLGVGDAEGEE
jgi:hypothetical protein